MNVGGLLIAVVGPSGVGKDSVIAGVLAATPSVQLVKRTITRAPDLGGEAYNSVSEEEFSKRASSGDFCLYWNAHGLSYGIPSTVLSEARLGRQYLANLSRSVLSEANSKFPNFAVFQLTASPEILAHRLAQRGRESEEDIAARLARSTFPLPGGLRVYRVSNDGALADTVDQVVQIIGELSDAGKQTAGLCEPKDIKHL